MSFIWTSIDVSGSEPVSISEEYENTQTVYIYLALKPSTVLKSHIVMGVDIRVSNNIWSRYFDFSCFS